MPILFREVGASVVKWMMRAKARCGETSTIVVAVYRQSVWLSVEPSSNSEAILEPAHVDRLVNKLIQAAKEARECRP